MRNTICTSICLINPGYKFMSQTSCQVTCPRAPLPCMWHTYTNSDYIVSLCTRFVQVAKLKYSR